MPEPTPATRAIAGWRLTLALALAYSAIGFAALQLAVPPTYASPLFPSAGLALAATLTWGARALPGVWAGSALLNAGMHALTGDATAQTTLVACLTAVGAALQAWLGAALVRRVLPGPLTLDNAGEFVRFMLAGAVVAGLTSASVATLVFVAAGITAPADAFFVWWVWWSGDAIGIVIGAPMALAFIGTPRAVWLARRTTVGLPLALATLLVGTAIAGIAALERERLASQFRQDAGHLAAAAEQRLEAHLAALHAAHGVFIASQDVTRAEFRAATRHWLQNLPGLRALGYSTWLAPDDVPAFVRRVQAEDIDGFQVFDRAPGGSRLPVQTSGELAVITYIEPQETNAAALGANTMSILEPRAAILQAINGGGPVATGGFRLTQDNDDAAGVVVYRAIRTADDRVRGLAFATMRMDQFVASVPRGDTPGLVACLLDLTPAAPRRLLAGSPACEAADAARAFDRPLGIAGRQWQLRVLAESAYFAAHRNWAAWSFSVAGALTVGLLGAYLLVVTGRTRRIEQIVDERTEALRREVAERTATAAALRASEERVRAVFDAAPVGLSIATPDGAFVHVNPQYAAMVGRSVDELRLLTIRDVTHPDDRAADRRAHVALLAGNAAVLTLRKRYRRPDGSELPAEVVVTVERDADGRPRALIGVATDISERLRLAAAEQAQRIAEASSRAKTEFLSRMSHELRTPLNAILGFAQLAEMDRAAPPVPAQRERLQLIQSAGWHLLEMINDVLDLSLIEAGGVRLAQQPLDVNRAVGDAVAMVRPVAERRGIAIHTALAPGLPDGVGDVTRLRQVLGNLLSNAVKYNRDRGEVRVVTAAVPGGRLQVRVTDTGIGFTPAQLEQLFQPFNRLGREHGKTEGAGIGLVIARRLVELMGGTLAVESHGEAGTTFICTLQTAAHAATHERPSMDANDPAPAVPAPAAAAAGPGGLVLYIEDNHANAEVMRGFLQMRPRLELQVCPSVADGLAVLRQRVPLLLLLDMNLPDGTGLEVLAAVRGDPRLARVPVVVVSADAMASQIDAALRAGADSYLPKPLRLPDLLMHIDDALRLAAANGGAPLPIERG